MRLKPFVAIIVRAASLPLSISVSQVTISRSTRICVYPSAAELFSSSLLCPSQAMSQLSAFAGVNPLEVTATELQSLLADKSIDSSDLVNLYLQQIEKHNIKGLGLRAFIATAPRRLLLEAANKLDDERASGAVRGPLHGVPIILKACILQHLLKSTRTDSLAG